jgi:Ras GTPase-activating-like protein IQGAP2/3
MIEKRETDGLIAFQEPEEDVKLAVPTATSRRKISGSAFKNVIVPPSDPITTEIRRQQPRSSGVEQRLAKLGIQDTSTGKTSNLRIGKPSTLGLGKPSNLGLGRPSGISGPTAPGKRVISIGKTDGRVLGRHLPRVVSASKPPPSSQEHTPRKQAEERQEVKRDDAARDVEAVERSRPVRASRVEEIRNGLIRKSMAVERDAVNKAKPSARNPVNPSPELESSATFRSSSPASPIKRSTPTDESTSTFRTPPASPARLKPDGRGMAGLTGKSAAAPLSPRPGLVRRQDSTSSVTGYNSRLRLSRGLPLSSSSANLAPAPLPSKRLNTNWMDKQRKALVAYEYLCHVGEAQQWIEGCLGEELGWGVVEMEEEMRDGVALAKLCRVYQGEQVVKTIWEVSVEV